MEFQIDLQEGFYPAMKIIIWVDGQEVFNKEAQTNPIKGMLPSLRICMQK